MAFVSLVVSMVMWSFWSNAILWACVSILAVAEWRRHTPIHNALFSLGFAVGVVLLSGVLIGMGGVGENGYEWGPLMAFLCVIWSNDIGAYLVGKPFGKHKLLPRISPGKSWEGLVGGLVAAGIVSGWAFGWNMCWIGVVLGVAATCGDLVESAWKRSLGIKDSGALLPGHGGVLDRFDGFLFAVPMYAAVLWGLDISPIF